MKENGTFYGESQKTLAGGAQAALIPESITAPAPIPQPAAACHTLITPLAVWQDFTALSCSTTESLSFPRRFLLHPELGTDFSKQMIQRTKAPVRS